MGRTTEDIQDELLVLRCQEGDEQALRELFARWQPRFTRLATALLRQRSAVPDVLQDAWLAIVRGLRRLQDPGGFRTWACRIVRNKCVDAIRRRTALRRSPPHHPEASRSEAPDPAATVERSAEVSRLRQALERLPEQQRAVLALRYLEDMSVAEMAEVLSVPEGTVKSRLHHARNELKEALERSSHERTG